MTDSVIFITVCLFSLGCYGAGYESGRKENDVDKEELIQLREENMELRRNKG